MLTTQNVRVLYMTWHDKGYNDGALFIERI